MRVTEPSSPEPDDLVDREFDAATTQGEETVRLANALVLEVSRPLARKVALYERTFGLAVVPVLIRRKLLALIRYRQARRKLR